MSITNEAEVHFVSRHRLDAAYHHRRRDSDATAPADATAAIGFQAHFSFLPGFFTRLEYFIISAKAEVMRRSVCHSVCVQPRAKSYAWI